MVWIAFALMTAAVVLCLVWPLSGARASPSAASADIAFYRSQLAEIEDDIARGLLAAGDAEPTRAEIARRLLAAHGSGRAPAPGRFERRRVVAMGSTLVLVPSLALALYLRIGSPDQPDMPIAARTTGPGTDVASALAKIEAHLVSNPNDGRGYELIAPLYLQLGRFDDASRAYGATLRLLGESAERRAALGRAIVMAADGVVTAEARAAFDKAVADDPTLPQARFFLAVAAEQDGDKDRAIGLWRALQADTPANAPWQRAVAQHLAALTEPPAQAASAPKSSPQMGPGGPTADGIAALPPEQRLAAIRGMVEGLAFRLAQNGRDPEGWLRLIRAYTVLGDAAKARSALVDARKGLGGDAAALARVDDLARQLGLGG